MNDQKVQELIRVVDATLAEVNPLGLITGQNTLSIIKFISLFPGFNDFVSPQFVENVNDQLIKSEGKQNVREHVKKILTFPKTGYPPWITVDHKILTSTQLECIDVKFKIQLVDGKVYGLCLTNPTISDIIFNEFKDRLPGFKLNSESSHITIVNSNIVADIGIETVKEFISYQEFFVITKGIKSTVSEDWPVFSECYVVEIECEYIDEFVKKFNQKFNKNIKITKHITFAIKPRSLWGKN